MKNLAFLFIWIYCIQLLQAQDKFKFGEVSQELLNMTVYDKDSAASAFVVYENQDVYYQWNGTFSDFELISEYTVRIKILTADGVEQANGSIPFYKGSNSTSTETISGLTGWTYNRDDGKVVKAKLSKDYIFTEDVTENLKRLKFALPAVKAGSVIEYKYRLKSPFYYYPEDFRFQRSIPVKYSHFTIAIPEYFVFNRETKGYEPIKINIEPVNLSFLVSGQMLSCSGEKISAEVFDLPALKDENFVWNYNDFMAGISFELKKIAITGVYYKDYAQSWSNVVANLMSYDNFGGKLKNKGLFKDELAAIKTMEGDDEEKLRAILDLVRSKMKWNERNSLYINNPSKALKEGVGTSAEINSLLFNAVKNAGYEAGVVVMSLRTNGRIPMTYPSRDNFNYFIVQVKCGEKTYYMDATRSYCDLNIIPVYCLVDKALCIYEKKFDWVDMTKIGNNTSRITLLMSFNEDGMLTGQKSAIQTGECIFSFKQSYEKAKDEAEYIRNLETSNDIAIADYTIEERRISLVETYSFTSNTIRLEEDNLLIFRPLLFEAMQSNPLKQEERKLPVEFSYPQDERINVNILIPEGYVLDEAPKSERFVYGDDKSIECSYLLQTDGPNVQIAYRFKSNVCIVPASQYAELRDLFSKIYAKCQEVLVFKKQ